MVVLPATPAISAELLSSRVAMDFTSQQTLELLPRHTRDFARLKRATSAAKSAVGDACCIGAVQRCQDY
jgi:hypothetical protein